MVLTGVAVAGTVRLGVVRIFTTPVLINRAADFIEDGAFAGHFQNFHRAEIFHRIGRRVTTVCWVGSLRAT